MPTATSEVTQRIVSNDAFWPGAAIN